MPISGQSPHAIATLWDLIALPTLNLRAAEASLALGAFVFQVGLLSDAAAGDVGLHRAPLQQVIGDPAARALAAAGVTVHLRWRAERITTLGGRFAVVGAGGWLGADAVVLAVPHERAAAMLPPEALRGARWPGALGSSPIVNLHFVYDRRVLEQRFAAGIDTPAQYLFDRTPPSWNERQYVAVSLSGADAEMAMSPAALRERYEPALAELLPAARDARVDRFAVTKEHAATFRATPGTASFARRRGRRSPGSRSPARGPRPAGRRRSRAPPAAAGPPPRPCWRQPDGGQPPPPRPRASRPARARVAHSRRSTAAGTAGSTPA